jgi:hypothetical protein
MNKTAPGVAAGTRRNRAEGKHMIDDVSRPDKARARENWPPPPTIRLILKRLRKRYTALPRTQRPNSAADLLTVQERIVLVKAGQYPLSQACQQFVVETTVERARRRKRLRVGLLHLLAADIGGLVARLTTTNGEGDHD